MVFEIVVLLALVGVGLAIGHGGVVLVPPALGALVVTLGLAFDDGGSGSSDGDETGLFVGLVAITTLAGCVALAAGVGLRRILGSRRHDHAPFDGPEQP